MFCIGCAGSVQNGNQNGSKDSTATASQLDPSHSALVKVNNRLFNVPSPLQLAGIFKKFNLPYRNEMLNSVGKRSDYTTSFKQALNVGVYGCDLGYINVYEQLPDAAQYFAAIRSLTTELGILNSFSEQTMKRIEDNNGDKDSLLYIASIIYRESDSYLMNSERNEIGALIIAGGWVEGLYFLTHLQSIDDMDAGLFQIIGQQKRPLDNLIELLRPYYNKLNPAYDEFLEKLSDVANIYEDITVNYTYKASETDDVNKITIINSESTVSINKAQVKHIAEKIAEIRADITK
ncbi:MAG: hypothetical protein MJZ61_07155 [Bacteroidales bacterium]|nr:hypothetical protein [Bacteroidales bacterium]